MNEVQAGLMLYFKQLHLLSDQTFLQKCKAKGIDSFFLVVKDYNGLVISESDIKMLKTFTKQKSFKLYAWVCCLTEGYSGLLTSTSHNPRFIENSWSVVDKHKIATVEKPVECDYGNEYFACPSNEDFKKYLADIIFKLEASGVFCGFLFDLVRFPLGTSYCYCEQCNLFSRRVYNADISSLSEFKRFKLRNMIVKEFVEYLQNNVGLPSSYLVWPKLGADLGRSQDFENWDVEYLSPMIYPSISRNLNKLLNRFSSSMTKNVIPLILIDFKTLVPIQSINRSSGFIYTHYMDLPFERNFQNPIYRIKYALYLFWSALKYHFYRFVG